MDDSRVQALATLIKSWAEDGFYYEDSWYLNRAQEAINLLNIPELEMSIHEYRRDAQYWTERVTKIQRQAQEWRQLATTSNHMVRDLISVNEQLKMQLQVKELEDK